MTVATIIERRPRYWVRNPSDSEVANPATTATVKAIKNHCSCRRFKASLLILGGFVPLFWRRFAL
jgi:hypothetical protein